MVTEPLTYTLENIYLYWGLNVRNVRELTTEEVREAWRNTLIPTGENTYEFVDPDVADTEFNLWLVNERHRVAQLAIEKERKRILSVLESVTCNCYDSCERIDTTLDELQTKIKENNG